LSTHELPTPKHYTDIWYLILKPDEVESHGE
jgi:hypothetical protein